MDQGSLSRWKIAWEYPNLLVLLCCSQGDTEDEIMSKAREHGGKEHNMKI
jgi:hypothetical protein